jgi:hypothetical protein
MVDHTITVEDIILMVDHTITGVVISQVSRITVVDINHTTVEDIILMANHITISQVNHTTVEDIILVVNHTVIEDTDLVIVAIVIIEAGFNLKVAFIMELMGQIIIVRLQLLLHQVVPSQQILYKLPNGNLLLHGDDQHSFL